MNNRLIHDIPAERITVLDNRYYTNDNINFYPGATTILGAYPKGPWYFKWLKEQGFENAERLLEEAGEKGSNVHNACEAIDNGHELHWADENGKPFFTLEEWQLILNYQDFKEKVQPVILANEMVMCSDELGYGGTLDRIVEFAGKRWLMDLKTSNVIGDTFILQLASYAKLWNEKCGPDYQVDDVCILWLKSQVRTEKINPKKNEWQGKFPSCPKSWQVITFDEPYEEAFKDFLAVKQIWKRANPNYKPLNLIYPDKIKP